MSQFPPNHLLNNTLVLKFFFCVWSTLYHTSDFLMHISSLYFHFIYGKVHPFKVYSRMNLLNVHSYETTTQTRYKAFSLPQNFLGPVCLHPSLCPQTRVTTGLLSAPVDSFAFFRIVYKWNRPVWYFLCTWFLSLNIKIFKIFFKKLWQKRHNIKLTIFKCTIQQH